LRPLTHGRVDCSTRRSGEPRPAPQCTFPSESVLVGSRYRVTAALCPLAVAPRCDPTGSARVRFRAKDSVRLREPPPPGEDCSLLYCRLRGLPGLHRLHRLLPLGQGSDLITSRMGMLWPVARTSTATIALPPRLRAANGPENRIGCSCLRRGWAKPPCGRSTAQLVPSETPDLVTACAVLPSGQRRVLDSPAPCAVASSRSRLVLRDSLGLEALLRRLVPNPLRALRLGLDSLLPWVSIPLSRSSSPQPAPARAGAPLRGGTTVSLACAGERPAHST